MSKTFLVFTFCSLLPAALLAEPESMRSRLGDKLKEDSAKAAEAAKAAAQQTEVKKEDAKEEKVIDLPKYQVQGRKVPKETETTYEAKMTVEKLDKKIEREKKNTEPTKVDTALNPDTYSYLGNRSAAISAEEAKQRVRELELKQSVAAVSVDPASDPENKKLLEMLKDLEYRKNKDNVEERKK